MNVVAVIGDVVSSRGLKNRQEFQNRLEAAAQTTNQLPGSGLISPYTVTLGDEVQAVYGTSAARLVDQLLYLWGGVSPQRMRFAVGVGRLTTLVNPLRAIGMDGPAFHAARDGMERQKESGRHCSVSAAADWDGPDLALADASLEMLSIQAARWRPARWAVVRCLIKGMTETETARKLSVGRQAVNQHVLSGSIRAVRRTGARIDDELTKAINSK